MGSILVALEKVFEKRGRRAVKFPSVEKAPYPDASKAVEDFRSKLLNRIRAYQEDHSPRHAADM